MRPHHPEPPPPLVVPVVVVPPVVVVLPAAGDAAGDAAVVVVVVVVEEPLVAAGLAAGLLAWANAAPGVMASAAANVRPAATLPKTSFITVLSPYIKQCLHRASYPLREHPATELPLAFAKPI